MRYLSGYVIDADGFWFDTVAVDLEDGGVIPEGVILEQPTVGPFYKMKWSGVSWVEGATQEEIDELTKPQSYVPSDTEILGQQMTEREIESMAQGQQITDIELRMIMIEMEVANNV